MVEQLPLDVYEAIPVIINDIFGQGYDTRGPSSCNVVAASQGL